MLGRCLAWDGYVTIDGERSDALFFPVCSRIREFRKAPRIHAAIERQA
jgi:hypothetical protein